MHASPGEERGRIAALCLIAPVALAAWTVAASRIALRFLSSELPPKSAAAAGVLAALLSFFALYVLALGVASLLARPLRAQRPLVLGAIGVAIAGGLLG